MTSPALFLEGLTVTRGSGRAARDILVGVDLEVAAGEVVGVSGRSGSGKSSLLAMLSGDLTPTAGRITVAAGTAAAGPPTRIRRARPGTIAVVAQDPASTLDPLWAIGRIVAEPLRAAGVARADAARRAREALTAVSLGHLDPRRRPRQLSVGQAQRVAIARALAGRPALLLADEPTSALDVTTAAGVAELLRAAAGTGAAVVVASHDHRLLDALSDRRLAIDSSRLVSVPHRLGLTGTAGDCPSPWLASDTPN